jgi:N-acetyl sugar amidotransferase
MLETKYGLPQEVKFCKKCTISNQRPNSCQEFKHNKDSKKETIEFDSEGVCSACRIAQMKENIDWNLREKELIELCNKYRRNDGRHDVLIPGSGGKDSFFQAWQMKYVYGMHPLLVTFSPNLYTTWGWNNFQRWIHAGFDNYLFTPNGRMARLMTRLSVENLFHPFQSFIYGQKALGPKLATLFKIPFVLYGESESEYGNKRSEHEKSQRDWSYFTASNKNEIYLGGTSIQSLIEDYGINEVDLNAFMPANPEDIIKNNIEVHYLGYFKKWHPQECYYFAVENGGFEPAPERTPGTYSKYNSIDDKIDDFHYYTTYIKFGIGRSTYDSSQEIRNGEITREEGVALVKKYDGEFPERFVDEIFKYLSIAPKEFPIASKMFEQPIMDRDYFMNLADKFRSEHLWKKEYGIWKLRHTVWNEENGETNPDIPEDN